MTAVSKKLLKGKIAVVAGATRGAGRGIAIALGEAGATVYCTAVAPENAHGDGPPHPADLKRSKKPVNWSRPPAGAALP
jgi:NAD(P)-dependent dehydrogenase (short-subunit alcohol dehydrogenase family)